MKLTGTKKKIVLSVALVSAITVAGLQNAGAKPWDGGQCGECDRYRGQQQLTEETNEARNAFLTETVDVRKEIAVKKAEKRALMISDTPDAKRIAHLTGEIFDLREQLKQKAREKGLKRTDLNLGKGHRSGGPGPKGFQGRL